MSSLIKHITGIVTNRLCMPILNRKRELDCRRFLESQKLPDINLRPVFILGPPRCGSTLIYQAMTHYFKLCYFSNEMMHFPYDFPCRIAQRKIGLTNSSNFTNYYGRTSGKNAPHEGFPFWRRFYPRKTHDYIQDCNFLSDNYQIEIKHTIQYMEQIFEAPFITKTIENSLRLRSLRAIFPDAVFILVVRKPEFIIQSILTGRKTLYKNINHWMGARPANYEVLRRQKVIDQVMGQVHAIYKTIATDTTDLTPHIIHYEDFCRHPEVSLKKAEAFFKYSGIDIKRTHNFLPKSFDMKENNNLPPTTLRDIEHTFCANPLFKKYYEL